MLSTHTHTYILCGRKIGLFCENCTIRFKLSYFFPKTFQFFQQTKSPYPIYRKNSIKVFTKTGKQIQVGLPVIGKKETNVRAEGKSAACGKPVSNLILFAVVNSVGFMHLDCTFFFNTSCSFQRFFLYSLKRRSESKNRERDRERGLNATLSSFWYTNVFHLCISYIVYGNKRLILSQARVFRLIFVRMKG